MSVLSELSQSARSLSKSPSLPLIAVLSLGLGVGVNTTLYSVVKSMLLDDISAAEPSRLVRAWVGGTNRMSYANFRDMEDTRAFQGWAGYTLYIIKQQTGSNTDKVWGQLVTGNYFDVLGVKAALGRTFSPEEASPERNPLVAVISNSYWRQQFGGDPGVLGREMRLNGQTFTVIGVLPEDHRGILGFSFAPKIYVPFSTALNAELLNRAQTSILEAFGRLAHGVSEPQARSALLTRADELKHRFPAVNEHLNHVQLYGMSGWRKFSAKGFPVPVLIFSALLLGMSGMVLLIACANIAGLLLARGVNRQRDIAVRLALGASKSDIFRHLMAESFLLATLGTGAGLLVSIWANTAVTAIPLPVPFPIELHLTPDWKLLAYVAGLAFLATVACGLTPAWQALKTSVGAGLGGRSATSLHGRLTLRNVLVAGQIAASCALLVVASMFLRSLQHVSHVDPGFAVDRILNVKLDPQPPIDIAIQTMARIPGVLSVSGAMLVPMSGEEWITEAELPSSRVPVGANSVLEGYFDTMKIPVVEGRGFLPTDGAGSAQVGVVNQTFARRHFGSSGAIGQTLRLKDGPDKGKPFEIVGVVADTKYSSLGEDQRLQVYRPVRQVNFGALTLHLRTAGPPAALIPSVRSAVAGWDRNAVVEMQAMQDALAVALLPGRMAAVVLGAMGILGLVLAVIGLYGTLAYAVSRRTAEIGIRVALGASRGEVLGLVLRDGSVLVIAGIVAGVAMAAAVSIPLAQFVAGVKFTDPLTLLPVALLMLAVGAAASAIPARRATRVDPIVALRYE